MKNIFFLFVAMFFSVLLFAQNEINENNKPEVGCTYLGLIKFKPDQKLLDPAIWTRVCEYRFECSFLRLAVLWDGQEYLLVEMDGEERLLARNKEYQEISKIIIQLTLK